MTPSSPEESQGSFSDASWTPPWGVVKGMPHQEETPGKSQDMLGGLCHSAGLEMLWDPLPGESVRGEGSLGIPAQTVAPGPR